ncbi:MAG: hypothetical protein WDO12_04755 [Pseudomonadota bacterium]
MTEWQKFFLIRFPLAVLAVALVVEVAASLLHGVTLHRHNVDDLANAVAHDNRPYKVVLLGDSVTHNVAHKYRIGDADEVADLTTHAFAGLPSSMFLLQRYLVSGHRPQHVVMAVSRGIFVQPMDKGMFAYYVSSVFTHADEREFLKKYYADYVDYRWRPAALSATTRIGEPLFSLLRHPGDAIWAAPDSPAPKPVLEQFADDRDENVFNDRVKETTTIRPEARAVLESVCSLSKRFGFHLHLLWAPMDSRLHAALQANGNLQRIDAQLPEIFTECQSLVTVNDTSATQEYPYFDRGLIHIKGLGWEQQYALQLASFIHGFQAPAVPAADPR